MRREDKELRSEQEGVRSEAWCVSWAHPEMRRRQNGHIQTVVLHWEASMRCSEKVRRVRTSIKSNTPVLHNCL